MRSRSRSSLVCVLAALALSCGGGRWHDQEEGAYVFQAEELLRDDCGLLGGAGPLYQAGLRLSGHLVELRTQPLPGAPADFRQYEMLLVGQYLSGLEEFRVDGSVSNVTSTLPSGRACLLELVTLHMDAVTDTPTAFHGVLTVRYDARASDACSCELSAHYRAEKL